MSKDVASKYKQVHQSGAQGLDGDNLNVPKVPDERITDELESSIVAFSSDPSCTGTDNNYQRSFSASPSSLPLFLFWADPTFVPVKVRSTFEFALDTGGEVEIRDGTRTVEIAGDVVFTLPPSEPRRGIYTHRPLQIVTQAHW